MPKIVRIWVVSAIIILLVIIGVYYSLENMNSVEEHEHTSR